MQATDDMDSVAQQDRFDVPPAGHDDEKQLVVWVPADHPSPIPPHAIENMHVEHMPFAGLVPPHMHDGVEPAAGALIPFAQRQCDMQDIDSISPTSDIIMLEDYPQPVEIPIALPEPVSLPVVAAETPVQGYPTPSPGVVAPAMAMAAPRKARVRRLQPKEGVAAEAPPDVAASNRAPSLAQPSTVLLGSPAQATHSPPTHRLIAPDAGSEPVPGAGTSFGAPRAKAPSQFASSTLPPLSSVIQASPLSSNDPALHARSNKSLTGIEMSGQHCADQFAGFGLAFRSGNTTTAQPGANTTSPPSVNAVRRPQPGIVATASDTLPAATSGLDSTQSGGASNTARGPYAFEASSTRPSKAASSSRKETVVVPAMVNMQYQEAHDAIVAGQMARAAAADYVWEQHSGGRTTRPSNIDEAQESLLLNDFAGEAGSIRTDGETVSTNAKNKYAQVFQQPWSALKPHISRIRMLQIVGVAGLAGYNLISDMVVWNHFRKTDGEQSLFIVSTVCLLMVLINNFVASVLAVPPSWRERPMVVIVSLLMVSMSSPEIIEIMLRLQNLVPPLGLRFSVLMCTVLEDIPLLAVQFISVRNSGWSTVLYASVSGTLLSILLRGCNAFATLAYRKGRVTVLEKRKPLQPHVYTLDDIVIAVIDAGVKVAAAVCLMLTFMNASVPYAWMQLLAVSAAGSTILVRVINFFTCVCTSTPVSNSALEIMTMFNMHGVVLLLSTCVSPIIACWSYGHAPHRALYLLEALALIVPVVIIDANLVLSSNFSASSYMISVPLGACAAWIVAICIVTALGLRMQARFMPIEWRALTRTSGLLVLISLPVPLARIGTVSWVLATGQTIVSDVFSPTLFLGAQMLLAAGALMCIGMVRINAIGFDSLPLPSKRFGSRAIPVGFVFFCFILLMNGAVWFCCIYFEDAVLTDDLALTFMAMSAADCLVIGATCIITIHRNQFILDVAARLNSNIQGSSPALAVTPTLSTSQVLDSTLPPLMTADPYIVN